jgi:hypothetical protein
MYLQYLSFESNVTGNLIGSNTYVFASLSVGHHRLLWKLVLATDGNKWRLLLLRTFHCTFNLDAKPLLIVTLQ